MPSSNNSSFTRREFLYRASVTAVAASAVPSLLTSCGDRDTEYHTIIKGGTVYDGTTAKPYVADIAIRDDRIAAIGNLEGSAKTVVDARGKVVAPGFIDVHTHCDLTFKRTGLKRHMSRLMPSWKGNYNYLYQGVSTVVTGNCGYGFTDTERWLSMVDSVGFGTNVAHLVPHGMIREELFGDNQPGTLTRSQLEKMKDRVNEEMEKGAIGMSTGLEYAPGLLTETAELVALAGEVAKKGGIYTSHIRDESGRSDKSGRHGVLNSLDEAIFIGNEAAIPVEVSHLKIAAPMENVRASMLLEKIGSARRNGLDITADQYPYAAGSTHIAILLPGELVSSLGVKEKYRTKDGLKEVEKAILEVFAYLPPEKILITMFPEREELEGKTLKESAEMMDMAPEKAYAEMVSHESAPVGVFFAQDMEVVRDIMPAEFVFTASDGWTVPKDMTHPHPRCYGTYPRKLGRFVREEKILQLQQAILSMTSRPAQKFGIKDRGVLAKGKYADIVVLDPAKIIDNATYRQPHMYAQGVEYLLVNGRVSMEKGTATGHRGGRSLKRG